MTAPTALRPVAGPKFRAVAKLHFDGDKRRKVAALIAAFEDAGKPSCAPVELAERLGLDARKVAVLCKALKDAGRLEQTRNCRGKPAMWRRYRILLRETER